MIQNFTFWLERYEENKRPPLCKAHSFDCKSSGSSVPQSPRTWRDRAARISSLGMLAIAFGVATTRPSENFGCGSPQTVDCWLIEYPLVEGVRNEGSVY